jgi:hypothetical protein
MFHLILIESVTKLYESECFPVVNSYVWHIRFFQAVKIVGKMLELLIVLIVIKRQDRYAIIYIEGKAEATVIYDQHILHVSIIKNSQILDVPKWSWDAVLSVQSSLEDLIVWINKIKY